MDKELINKLAVLFKELETAGHFQSILIRQNISNLISPKKIKGEDSIKDSEYEIAEDIYGNRYIENDNHSYFNPKK